MGFAGLDRIAPQGYVGLHHHNRTEFTFPLTLLATFSHRRSVRSTQPRDLRGASAPAVRPTERQIVSGDGGTSASRFEPLAIFSVK